MWSPRRLGNTSSFTIISPPRSISLSTTLHEVFEGGRSGEANNWESRNIATTARATNLFGKTYFSTYLLMVATPTSGESTEERDHCKLNNMSAVDEEAADTTTCCASCGKAEVDDVKLKICTACKLVKYCSVECQKNHRQQHKKACKKRAAEIRDDRLFTQPEESHLGECPICCLPLPLDHTKWVLNSCCCKGICNGCNYANKHREIEQGLEERCPYCRELMPKANEEMDQNLMKRATANDPIALFDMGVTCYKERDYEGAVGYYAKAAALGNADAHFNLSAMYQLGEGVEKDKKKEMYHLEEAAIGGHPMARNNLGAYEGINGRNDRAMKHFIIAANLGNDDSLENVKKGFALGFVSEEDFEAALRGHQAAVDETKSEQREEAYAFGNLPQEEQIRRLRSLRDGLL